MIIEDIQGCTKRWAQGYVRLGAKVAFCSPAAGKRMQFLNPIFTEPGVHLLVHPCLNGQFNLERPQANELFHSSTLTKFLPARSRSMNWNSSVQFV